MTNEDLLGRIDTAALYQPFLERLNALVNECARQGYAFRATCGLRSHEEQARLYAIGRTTGSPGHFVTKAKPGQSLHQFGVAADFCLDADPDKPGLQPTFESPAYASVLAKTAEGLGLEAGAFWNFKDEPHVQLPIARRGVTLSMLQQAYESGGSAAVFRLLDSKGPW